MTLGWRCVLLPFESEHLALRPEDGALAAASAEGLAIAGPGDCVARRLAGKRLRGLSGLAWTRGGLACSQDERTLLLDPGGRVRVEAPGAGALTSVDGALLRLGAAGLEVLDPDTLAPVRHLADAGVVFAARGPHALVIAGTQASLIAWATGEVLARRELPLAAQTAGLSADGRSLIAAGWHDAAIGGWEGPMARCVARGPIAPVASGWLVGARLVSEDGARRRSLRVGGSVPAVRSLATSPGCAALLDGDRVHVVDPRRLDLGAARDEAPIVGAIGQVERLALSPGGRRLASSCSQGQVLVWDAQTRAPTAAIDLVASGRPLLFLPDGRLLVGTYEGVEVFDADSGRWLADWRAPELTHVSALERREDEVLAVGHDCACLFSGTGELRARFGPWQGLRIEAGALSPRAGEVVLAREDASVVFTRAGEERARLPAARRLAFVGEHLLLDGAGGARAWTCPEGQAVGELRPHFAAAAPVADGVLWCSGDVIGEWPLDPAGEGRWISRFRDAITSLAAAPEGDRFYTGTHAGWIGERARDEGRLLRALPAASGGRVLALAFDRSGRSLAVGDASGRLHLWRVAGEPTRAALVDGSALQPAGSVFAPGELGQVRALAWPGPLHAAADRLLRWDEGCEDPGQTTPEQRELAVSALTPDGRRALLGETYSQEYAVVDTASGAALLTVEAPESRHVWARLSGDGERLLIASALDQGAELGVWSVATGRRIAALHVDRELRGVAWLGGDVVLSFAGRRGPLARWQVERGEVERWLAAPAAVARAPEIEVAGDRALLWGEGAAYLLDLAAGRLRAVLPEHEHAASTAGALSPDARLAATADDLGRVRLWDARAGTWLATLCCTAEGGAWVRTPERCAWTPGPWARGEVRR